VCNFYKPSTLRAGCVPKEEIGNSQNYHLVPNLSDEGRRDEDIELKNADSDLSG
jgi:hypothetical protein